MSLSGRIGPEIHLPIVKHCAGQSPDLHAPQGCENPLTSVGSGCLEGVGNELGPFLLELDRALLGQ